MASLRSKISSGIGQLFSFTLSPPLICANGCSASLKWKIMKIWNWRREGAAKRLFLFGSISMTIREVFVFEIRYCVTINGRRRIYVFEEFRPCGCKTLFITHRRLIEMQRRFTYAKIAAYIQCKCVLTERGDANRWIDKNIVANEPNSP